MHTVKGGLGRKTAKNGVMHIRRFSKVGILSARKDIDEVAAILFKSVLIAVKAPMVSFCSVLRLGADVVDGALGGMVHSDGG